MNSAPISNAEKYGLTKFRRDLVRYLSSSIAIRSRGIVILENIYNFSLIRLQINAQTRHCFFIDKVIIVIGINSHVRQNARGCEKKAILQVVAFAVYSYKVVVQIQLQIQL